MEERKAKARSRAKAKARATAGLSTPHRKKRDAPVEMTAVGVMLAKSKDKNQSRTSDVKFTAMPHLARGFA